MKQFKLPKDGGIIMQNAPESILHACEKIFTNVYENEENAVEIIANNIKREVDRFFAINPGKIFKIGFSSGSSPKLLFSKLADMNRAGKLSFKNIEIFFTDEYFSQTDKGEQQRCFTIRKALLEKVDISENHIHIPFGIADQKAFTDYCAKFDEQANELDLLVIGIGEEGQVGFNEVGAERFSRTRSVLLSYNSRKRQAKNFSGDISKTPKLVVSMGMNTLLKAKKVFMMAWGEDKAPIVAKIVEQPIDPMCPASFFQQHSDVTMFADENAGSLLTREVAPWVLGPCEWTPKFRRKAVIWLSQRVGKPILELSEKDYLRNSLDELLEHFGSYDQINIDVFNDLQHTITGWPGGKPNTDDPTRPVSSVPYPKTVLIFSPHPDDDVISMGGTFIRLVHQGHNVHVAYETSGNVAVHDDVVIQHMDAARELGFGDRIEEVQALVDSKRPGEPEPRALLDIKAAIRRSEARGADRSFGLESSHVHFLNLPFYESGGIVKLPRSQKDVDIIKALMNELQPHQIYMAGDLADPHGTHRVCTECALEALRQCAEDGAKWVSNCAVWLYRGAWMEWELGRVDMAVPISPAEVIEKRHAIYHHLSQKDIVPFPGEDPREFWQRAEDRTQNTAKQYKELGMATYQAMEVFVKLPAAMEN